MQESIFKNCLIPLYFRVKGLNRYKYYKKIKKRDSMTQDELKHLQWEKLKALINHCYTKIPYYTKLFKENNILPENIKTLNDFTQMVPELKKQDIRDNCNELINPELPKSKLCYDSTSGSTGLPLKFYRGLEDQEYGFALRYRSNEWCGWKYYDKSAWFVSDTRHISEIDKIKGKIELWLKRRLLIDTKRITSENMFEWVKKLKAFKPKQVYGYSSLLAEFAQFLIKNNIELENIEGVYSTAEVLRSRELISQAFNAPVYDQYGASEVPCIAHECKKGNMHLNMDEILLEFIDIPGISDMKKIVCTPLYIYGMPLLRYEIGDSAIISSKNCDCGLPYPVIELKVGRVSDNIISPTGKIVSGITFGWYLTEAIPGVSQFQVIQESINYFTVKIVSDNNNNEEKEENILKLLHEMLSTTDINVVFEYTEAIMPDSNGKYKPIISKVPSEEFSVC